MTLWAIKELGEQKLKREGRDISDLFSILVDDPNQDGRYPKVLMIVFKKTEDGYKYDHIAIEDASKSKIKKYLYSRGASMGPDITPTAKITEINKTFKNKIRAWFNEDRTKDSMVSALRSSLNRAEKDILNELLSKWDEVKQSLKRNQSGIITLAIKEDKELKYIGDYPIFKNFLITSLKEEYSKILRKNHRCSVCGEVKDEVYGNAIPIPFYTLDKPGYIAGAFRGETAWKNAPICLECSLKIREGKKFLDETRRTMGGQRYYLIPKFILGVKEAREVVDLFFKYATYPEEVLNGKAIRRLSEDEREVLEALGDLGDVLTYNFLFFEAPNPQVFKINLLIEDILPSRISTIFEAKKEAEKPEIFKNLKVKKTKYENIEFRFDMLKQFTPSQKAFLEVVDKTFRGINIDQDLLFSWFMTSIRQDFVNESYLKPRVLRAFVSFLFFKKLGILSSRTYFKERRIFMTVLKEKAEGFFANFPETFITPAHKAVFLLGILTQKLLNIQRRERGATPFMKNLKGLKMREEDVKALLPKIQGKLEEYDKNYYRSLESLISGYLIEAGKDWRISINELNFYFVLGMNLVDEIDKVLNVTKEEVENV